MKRRDMHKAEKAMRSAQSEYADADNGHCCVSSGAWVRRNVKLREIRETFPKGYDHKRHQRRLKAEAKRRHSKAQRRYGRLLCDG